MTQQVEQETEESTKVPWLAILSLGRKVTISWLDKLKSYLGQKCLMTNHFQYTST